MELSASIKQKIAQYKVSDKDLAPIKGAPLLFTVGITSAGKNAVLDKLIAGHPDDYRFIVSHTTRPPRENNGVMEQNGVAYHFSTPEEVDQLLDEHEFVEAKVIHSDTIYGTTIDEIKKAEGEGKIAATDVDIQGVAEYMAKGLNAKAVFLLPPDYDEWRRRLNGRSGELDRDTLRKRLQSALNELEHALSVDYYYIVINDSLDKTAELVNEIAHGEQVEPHYHKAMAIANNLRERLHAELQAL